MDYQVTLLCTPGAYKPVSCIVKCNAELSKKEIRTKGLIKIMSKRHWTKADLTKYGYTKIKIREYDKEKIEFEKKLHYELIKEQKYQSGEWQRPKNRTE